MDFFFHPEGIALIGATANPQKGGYAILRNLVTGYKGGIYPVNPRYPEIDSIKCYPSVAEVPDPVDLAIVFVPGKLVPQIIRDCAARGIRGVMIESGGFAESGAEGRAMQEELKHIARETGIRLWGPNCMGLVDAVNRCVFSFVSPSIWENFFSGNVSLVVQSGMLSGAFLIDRMSHGTMGISKVCSVGNKVDVNECELLEYLIKDLETDAIGLYLESIPDGRHFMEICRTSRKPIVVLKGGKSPRGAAAAMSHTASMAGDKAVVSGALAQVGVTEAKDFDQMTDLCRTLALYPHVECSGRGRIAILTYSGGAGIVSADFIHECGLELAELSEKSVAAMKTVFPDWMKPSNPVDLWPAVEQQGAEKAYGTAFRAACADPGVDAIFVHVFVGGFSLNVDLSELAKEARMAGKPVFCWVIGKSDEVKAFQEKARVTGVPIYREIGRAVECMNAVFDRKRMMDAGFAGEVISDAFSISDTANDLLHKESGVLDEYLSKQILSGCGIPTVREEIVTKAKEAVSLLSEMEGPLVMKGLMPGQVHKSESGLVRLWISTESGVRKHFKSLKAKIGDAGKILLQKQVEGGVELIAGMLRDPQFGPCVMFGLGGIMAEVLKDAVFASAPLTHEEALALVGKLKSRQMLNGFRGAEPADRDALAQILVNLGRLGLAFPQIREIDINPLIVTNGRPVAVDASVILAK
ncbi:MAG: acetate--CoA ligase family protein [Desulfobacterales bacterium]